MKEKKISYIIPKDKSQELDKEFHDQLVLSYIILSSVVSNNCLTQEQYNNALVNLANLPSILFIKKIKV